MDEPYLADYKLQIQDFEIQMTTLTINYSDFINEDNVIYFMVAFSKYDNINVFASLVDYNLDSHIFKSIDESSIRSSLIPIYTVTIDAYLHNLL